MQFSLRRATEADVKFITSLFQDTILTVNAKDYNPEQTEMWASAGMKPEKWKERIREQYFLLAETEGKLIGFASVSPGGCFDTLYVHKDYQRQGVARILLEKVEKFCQQEKASELYSDVSITARPFFETNGFEVEKEQKKYLNGVEFINYRMRKLLRS